MFVFEGSFRARTYRLEGPIPEAVEVVVRMAKEEVAEGGRNARRKLNNEAKAKRIETQGGEDEHRLKPDVYEVRKVRLERLEGSKSTRRSVATPKMTSDSHATLTSLKSSSSHRRRHSSRRSTVSTRHHTRHHTRRNSTSRDDFTPTYVYGTPADRSQSRITASETRKLGRDGDPSELEVDEETRTTQSDPIEEKSKTRKIRIVYKDEVPNSSKHRERRVKSGEESPDHEIDPQRSKGRSRAPATRRTSSAKERPASTYKRYCCKEFHKCVS